jgi:Putative DNA-binding domain
VRSLAELQASVAQAVVGGGETVPTSALVGGGDPRQRLMIHQRHYEASLADALLQKFPACRWLVGDAFVAAAARAYVHAEPPRQPCIAEYGDTFPQHLARWDRAAELPYLEAFATLEWTVGQVSIAIDAPALPWPALARLGSDRLLDTRVTLDPSVRYLRLAWGVDELMTVYMNETEPERFALPQIDAPIEIRGARGALSLTRLDAGAFTFRGALAAGDTIGAAATASLGVDPTFDPGYALRRLVDAGLVVGASTGSPETAT